ncbi:methyltransferase domain-containing protein [Paenalcaligenes niemegkensis]|uniref:methyltransferase domain-containing protein n=1 Tax=Paenalcaligenes niemegkensis TaxID=2895469 RepID=UPI001EE91D13|nr:methyltransferase domain-containing protein [Paenalcaligenes niemegkensis]MCQ9615592.1 methyltransferase domain-containing protein [Paenalcaligenes niemegkensis]
MSHTPSLPINSQHVLLQFNRRAPLDNAQFLYGEIAQRMLARLSYIRIDAQNILDAGCGAGHALDPLRSRYPDMDYVGVDHSPGLLRVANERYGKKPSLWERLRNQPTKPATFVQADLAHTGLGAESQNLVWSNMALHWHPDPELVFNEWRRLLRANGLAMFSALGPGSFIELRNALSSANSQTQTLSFVDMHDYGDQLLQNGFTDPVMDQETITLTYKTAEQLLKEVAILGGNASTLRRSSLTTKAWRDRLIQALNAQRHMDGTIHLTLEIAYGHAWRATMTRNQASGEISIPISSITRKPSS